MTVKKWLPSPVHKKDGRTTGQLDQIAGDCLSFLAAEPERLGRFFSQTGLTPQSLRRAAVDPGFIESLLDHFCSDENLLVAFAAEYGYAPEAVEATRQSLLARSDDWS